MLALSLRLLRRYDASGIWMVHFGKGVIMKCCRGCLSDITDTPASHFLCHRCYGDAARRLKKGKGFPDTRLVMNDLGLTVERIADLIAATAPHRPDLLDWLETVRDRAALTR
jgi:hypothetical protein